MAITLDELLGRNTQATQSMSVERFPSYEEFQSARSNYNTQNSASQSMQYNFDSVPARSVRTVESVRSYEAQRPYVAPQQSEYQTQDYAFYNNLRPRTQEQAVYQPMQAVAQPMPQQMPMQQVDYVQYQQPVQPQNLYEFTAQDTDRLSEEELFNRLAHTQVVAEQKKTSIFQRKAQSVKAGEKTHSKLNAKGKIIVGLYLAVIAVVVSLIAVNASKINHGQALTPASNVQIVEIAK